MKEETKNHSKIVLAIEKSADEFFNLVRSHA
jgi:hypothetical protein